MPVGVQGAPSGSPEHALASLRIWRVPELLAAANETVCLLLPEGPSEGTLQGAIIVFGVASLIFHQNGRPVE